MMTPRRRRAAACLLVLSGIPLLFTWPVLVHGLPDLSADGQDHARWARNFSSQLWHGEAYPRWLPGTNGGLGSPDFFLYPPLASYAASPFRPLLVARDPSGFLMAGWSAVLAGILSSIAAYLWLSDLTSPSAAMLGAATYTISPYHLAIDLYKRGALAEFCAFVWMPLILLGVKWCVEAKRGAIPLVAASYGLLVFTHLPTVVCFSWVVPLAVLMMSVPERRVHALVTTLAGICLGIGMSAIYLLPATFDRGKSWIDIVDRDSWVYYRNNYLFAKSASLLEYKTRVLLLVMLVFAMASVLYWLIRRFEEDRSRRRLALFYFVTAAAALFMMTQLSIPVYELLKFVQKIQFPSRFAGTLTVALAAMTALAYPLIARSRAVLASVILCVTGFATADGWAGSRTFSAWRPTSEERALEYQKEIELQGEVRHQWPRPADSPGLSNLPALAAFVAVHPARSLVLSMPRGMAEVESWQPREVAIRVHAPTDGHLTIGHFYYRDWRARRQSSGKSLAVTPSPEGLLDVEIPRGDYSLILALAPDTPEQAGIWISGLSFLAICGLAICESPLSGHILNRKFCCP